MVWQTDRCTHPCTRCMVTKSFYCWETILQDSQQLHLSNGAGPLGEDALGFGYFSVKAPYSYRCESSLFPEILTNGKSLLSQADAL